ncbi:MAG: hypothetical protein WCY01_06685 [Alkalispirochaeta sp.]
MRIWRLIGVVGVSAALLGGCWSVRPEEHIEFHGAVGLDRADLAAGTRVRMEYERDQLVATAILGAPSGLAGVLGAEGLEKPAVALFYVDRRDAGRSDLDGKDVTRIRVVRGGDGTNGAGTEVGWLERESSEFAAALRVFPILTDFREQSVGFDDPDDDGLVKVILGDDLQWNVSFTVNPGSGTAETTGMMGMAMMAGVDESVVVRFQAAGTKENRTRSIFLFVTRSDGERFRYTLKRGTYDVTRRLTARTQRLFRSVSWDGRFLLVYNRLIDTTTGAETVLFDRAPTTFVDHMVRRGGVTAVVYGSPRISKRVVVQPGGW